jgi:hypothetical protein
MRDGADHEAPRWAPDGASLVYYSPPAEGDRLGIVWEGLSNLDWLFLGDSELFR